MLVVHNGSLSTELYKKEKDKNTLLHYSSSHPRSMVKSLPCSQLMRARRITQNEEEWDDKVNQITNNFRERGYPVPLINKHIGKVKNNNTCGV